ncbi:MAG: twin-arginine translocase subunit TatB [Caldilineae bacterium]|nr:MAG: twin-arginine translocase subunit TatB [Caldilineae bacterium]
MFNIGLGEILFIALLALIFIGPERLPKVLRQLGELVYQLRLITNELTNQFSEELRPIRELQNLANDVNPMKQLGELLDVEGAVTPPPGAQQREASPNTIAPPREQQPKPENPMAQIAAAMTASTASNQDEPTSTAPATDTTADTESDSTPEPAE